MITELLTDKLRTRFFKKVRRTTFCWEWCGSKNNYGYGMIMLTLLAHNVRQVARAHRVSWELHRGEIPDGMQVLHKCDNPSCVNPDHLFVGNHSDNMRDMYAKGRKVKFGPHGDAHPNAVLTSKLVATLRARHANGERIINIAKTNDLEYGTVWAAVRGINCHVN